MLPFLCAAFVTGITLARYLSPPLPWLAALVAMSAAASVAAFFSGRRRAVTGTMLALFMMMGMLNLSVAMEAIHAPLAPYLGREVVITGHIHLMEDMSDDSCAFIFCTEQITQDGGKPRPVRALVRVSVFQPPQDFTPVLGQRLSIGGRMLAPAGKRNPGGFDYGSYLEASGVGAVLPANGRNVALLPGRGGSLLTAFGESLRQRVMEGLNSYLPPAEAGLAAGLLLGARTHLESETTYAYRTLGIAHLLAVSGLHVGFVVAFALFLARRLRLASWQGLLLTGLIVLAYVLLTGGRPSVWRAALMLGMGLTARWYGREADTVNGLAAAALVMLALRPYWLFSLSFQLSFLATLGILLLAPRLQPYFSRLPKRLIPLLAATVAAYLAVLPLQVIHFSLLPLLAVPVNLLCVPLVGVFMMIGLAGLAAGLIYTPLAAPFYLASLPVLHVLDSLPRLLAALPSAALRLQPLPAVWIVYSAILILFAAGVRVQWTRARCLLAMLVLVNLACWFSLAGAWAPARLEVSFLDVGQGLSVFIRSAEGRTVLVDAGGRRGGSFDPGERIVLPFLEQRRVKKLDLLVLTHPHEDHYGGMAAVVENIAVGRFAVSGETEDSASFNMLLESLRVNHVQDIVLTAGDRIVLDSATTISVLSPPAKKLAGTIDDVNNNSLVMLVEYGGFRLLITGDAEREALERLVAKKTDLGAILLQVPHHGSRHALFPSFLEAVNPEIAVISVGYNSFGHPHADTLDLLSLYGVHIYRTDMHGSVTVYSDGTGWRVTTFTDVAATAQ